MTGQVRDRRIDDSRLSRMEDRLDRAIRELAEHVSGCTRGQVHAQEWRENQTRKVDKVDGKVDGINNRLDQIALNLATAAGIKEGREWTVHLIWVGILAMGSVVGWALDHFKIFHG